MGTVLIPRYVVACSAACRINAGNTACVSATALDRTFSGQDSDAHQKYRDQEDEKSDDKLCHGRRTRKSRLL